MATMTLSSPYRYGAASLSKFNRVLPTLVAVANLALNLSWQAGGPDWSIVDGVRTIDQQANLVQGGASHTPKSAHLIQPSGFGEALDVRVYLGPGINPFPLRHDSAAVVREKLARFEQVARFWFEAADELGFPLQWGNDWDVDGIPTGRDPDEKGYLQDMVHFQNAPPHRIKQAIARAAARRALRDQGQLVIS
jgi:hypothetical protein